MNENGVISIKISLKCIDNGPINNIPVQMSWCRPGDKPFPEPMMNILRIYASLGSNELDITYETTSLITHTDILLQDL